MARGATIIGRNVRVGRRELDLLVRFDRIVVAVEVKTRVNHDARLAYTQEKSRNVREAMAGARPRPRRLDLVAVRLAAAGVDIRWLPGVA